MRLLYTYMFLLFTLVCKGQLYDKTWVVGIEAAKITFDNGQIVSDTFQHDLLTHLTWASICNSQGELQFFTSGFYVYDAYSNQMPGCVGMVDQGAVDEWSYGGPFPQGGALIFPASDTKYYIAYFSISDSQISSPNGAYAPDQLFYAEVDMTANNGFGAVTSKKNVLYSSLMVDNHMTACRHANGRDWWLVVNKYQTNTYLKWLVTPTDFIGPDTQSIGTPYYEPDLAGQLCFSPDGSKLAGVSGNSKLNIFDFDRCTGELSNPIAIEITKDTLNYPPNLPDIIGGGGVSLTFSPNGRFVYLGIVRLIHQYDLWDADIEASRKTIWTWKPSDGNGWTRVMFLAPNGEVVICCNNSPGCNGYSLIKFPNEADTACNFQHQVLSVPTTNPFNVNNTFNYRLGASTGSACDTIVNDINESGNLASYIKVAPNPAKDKLEISLYKYLPNAQMIIADELGRVVYQNSNYYLDEYLDVSRWNAGIYYIKIYNADKALTAKFLKE